MRDSRQHNGFDAVREGDSSADFTFAAWPNLDLAAESPERLLALVGQVDCESADERECFGAIAGCEQIERHVSALKVRLIHRAVTAGGPQEDAGSTFDVITGVQAVGAELAPLFGLSRQTAQNRVAQACNLVRDLPKLLDLVEAGATDLARAQAVDDVMREVIDPDDEVWGQVHEAVAEAAAGRSHRSLRELTRRVIHNADPEAAARRHEAKVAGRAVAVYPLPDAMASVTATLPADQALMVNSVLDALADGCRDHTRACGNPDPRTHEQRRADAFVALFRSVATETPLPVLPRDPGDDQSHFGGRFDLSAAPADGVVGWWRPPTLPRQQGRRPQIVITMPLSTLTGGDDNAADLSGYGRSLTRFSGHLF